MGIGMNPLGFGRLLRAAGFDDNNTSFVSSAKIIHLAVSRIERAYLRG